jgi:hypothetical protein
MAEIGSAWRAQLHDRVRKARVFARRWPPMTASRLSPEYHNTA